MGQTRIDGMDDKTIGLYAAGLTVRDMPTHLLDLYGLKVSPDLISRVTDAVLDDVREWFAARNQFAIMFEERFNA